MARQNLTEQKITRQTTHQTTNRPTKQPATHRSPPSLQTQYLEGLARCVELGLADAVGVSNFNAERVRGAARALEARGTCLASNQVQYSLIYREPERTGVVEACAEAGATVIACECPLLPR